jgi:hypothetical protein
VSSDKRSEGVFRRFTRTPEMSDDLRNECPFDSIVYLCFFVKGRKEMSLENPYPSIFVSSFELIYRVFF